MLDSGSREIGRLESYEAGKLEAEVIEYTAQCSPRQVFNNFIFDLGGFPTSYLLSSVLCLLFSVF